MAVVDVNISLAVGGPLPAETLLVLEGGGGEVVLEGGEAVSFRNAGKADLIAIGQQLGVVLHHALEPS